MTPEETKAAPQKTETKTEPKKKTFCDCLDADRLERLDKIVIPAGMKPHQWIGLVIDTTPLPKKGKEDLFSDLTPNQYAKLEEICKTYKCTKEEWLKNLVDVNCPPPPPVAPEKK